MEMYYAKMGKLMPTVKNGVKVCCSDEGLCSGIINGEWCLTRYPWAIINDFEMFGEYVDG